MGNSHLQFEACRILIGLLIDYLSTALRTYRVGAELNFLYDQDDPSAKVVPDLYILADEPQVGPKVPSWKPWEHEGKVPNLVIEVVSDSYRKDYTPEEMPQRYERLGVAELIRYDPDYAGHPRSKYPRRLFSQFLRDKSGALVERPLAEGAQQVQLHSFPFWLVHQAPYTLRLAEGAEADGLKLLPTASEVAALAQKDARAACERAESEKERAESEKERARRAEAEVERLRVELAALRAQARR